jgi:catechol 2,3-dioxygenase
MPKTYKIPSTARIGHIHLKVSDLNRSLDFYCRVLGFELITMYGKDAAFVSAGGYHHHIGLNTWYSKGKEPSPANHPGLFHFAVLFEQRRELAFILKRLMENKYPVTGASDHGVSEAIYLNDPDQNGIELYWDKPREKWPLNPDGSITMFTHSLDIENLLKELDNGDEVKR